MEEEMKMQMEMEMRMGMNLCRKGKRRLKSQVELLRQREINENAAHMVAQKLQVTDNYIHRLGLEKELDGHEGCVNCLEWNETGEVLASASDDTRVILWDPVKYEKKLSLHTGHNGNIFSIKFMPKSNDSVLVSGAGDCRVKVHELSSLEVILACNCHSGRVKRIGTAPNVPFLFWSAAEDGLILQYDVRTPHTCKSNDRNNVLVNLVNHAGRLTEAKCISVNTKRPELIAVGANDPYVRMYDRRMIKLSQIPMTPSPPQNWKRKSSDDLSGGDENIPLGCVQYFVAGHLHMRDMDQRKRDITSRSLSATYVTFSPEGNELLVNMGGEQIYLFDINDWRNTSKVLGFVPSATAMQTNEDDIPKENAEPALPEFIESLKRQGNQAFEEKEFNLAIMFYNKAIDRFGLSPAASVLYANRAAALMKRNWDGDIYGALRDCQVTLLLDPGHVKAHFRMARCLFDLSRAQEAYKVIKNFREKFPEYTSNSAFRALRKDIKEAIESAEMDDSNSSTRSNLGYLEFPLSPSEKEWRSNTIDYKLRFCGHCNTTTDIKEANFFGNDGKYIVAGSDDGSFFIWDRNTNIVRILRGDERIVNCLQPHPSTCLLATSGIDPVIRLWSPRPEDGSVNDREIINLSDAASANQIRMNSDPFELMLMNMGYRFPVQSTANEDGDGSANAAGDDSNGDENSHPVVHPLNCRPS